MAVIQRGPDRGPIYLYDLGPLLAQDSAIQGQNPPRDLLYVIEFSVKVSFDVSIMIIQHNVLELEVSLSFHKCRFHSIIMKIRPP